MNDDGFHLDDLAHLAKRLPHDVLGRFEPVTGLTLINISKAGHIAAMQRYAEKRVEESDVPLMRTLNHEMCHFVQFLSAGYMAHRNRVLWRAFNSWRNRLVKLRFLWFNVQHMTRLRVIRLFFGRRNDGRRRADQMAEFMRQNNKMVLINKITRGNPNSEARLQIPHFFQVLDAYRDRELELGPDAVSTLGIIEGAAVAYAALCEPWERTPDAFARRMQNDLADMPEIYGELWRFLSERAPNRAFELIMPLSALALSYDRPQVALSPLLDRLLVSKPGETDELARELFACPPRISEAGRSHLSASLFRDRRNRAPLYDTFVDCMRKDPIGLDDYRALTDPDYLNALQTIPICMQYSDGKSLGALMSNEERAARIMIAAMTLETVSRGRGERDSKKYLVNYFRAVINRNL